VGKLAVIGLAAVVLVACRAATEIDVTVQTDLPCGVGPTSLRVLSSSADASVSTTCERTDAGGYLGRVVLIPADNSVSAVDLLVTTPLDGGDCDPEGGGAPQGCITERRHWTFVPHDSLSATVLMPKVCVNVLCDGGTTCGPTGTCVDFACPYAGCLPDASQPPPADAGVDSASQDDTGVADSTVPDTSVADTGSKDTGSLDTGSIDTGPADSGQADTSTADSAVADTSTADSGQADTGQGDSGPLDSGQGDAGAEAATPDSGAPEVPVNHRPDDSQCLAQRDSVNCGAAATGCRSDSECEDPDAGTMGRCIQRPPQFAGCACSYDTCTDDSTCASGEVCVCHGSAYVNNAGNTCEPGNCGVDSDCAGGYCSPSPTLSCVGGVTGYYCHGPSDQCTNDSDCADAGMVALCTWTSSSASWMCAPIGACPQ
jgi:hypothetical protein